MKKNIFLLAVFLFIIAFNNEVFSAIKNKGRTSRSRAATRSVSGKLSGSNFAGSVQNISVVNSVSDDVMSCGVPAVATNAQAKRICALAMADAIRTSSSVVSSGILPISFKYILTGSSMATESEREIIPDCAAAISSMILSKFARASLTTLKPLFSSAS
jgi:hypothetical protein